jgi:hypothetical protein
MPFEEAAKRIRNIAKEHQIEIMESFSCSWAFDHYQEKCREKPAASYGYSNDEPRS